jgi:DNA-directed RNA polymerase I, II, and III subunit RPABC5
MIIPIKCFTCGNVLADKYRFYQEQVIKKKIEKAKSTSDDDKQKVFNMVYLTKENAQKTAEGEVLDHLELTNVCCRRHMLTHVNIE